MSCTLWLAPANRAIRMVSTDLNPLDPTQTAGLVPFETTEAELRTAFYPAYAAAAKAGSDCSVAEDGTLSSIRHAPDPADLQRRLLRNFLSNPAPTQADIIATLRALILEGD